ncbi:MAG: MFS transporter [Gammaproteobacteria bacterium]|nr:MFS transporter [Gammaproteobacteria bacterium]MDJ0892653.1 MFS transporter [Gammaproteobacteria bacterium]
MKNIFLRKPVLSWALYDWGNSAFATTVMAGFFPIFYSVLSEDISDQDSQFWFKITLAASGILVAVSAPILGAIGDRGGSRKRFLATFALLGVVATAGLAWVHAGMWQVGLALYALGSVGFAGANIFYDSMLVDVCQEGEFDMVSAYGYGLGYIGGGLLFAVNVLMANKPELFGLANAGAAVKASFVMVAAWWALFTVPLLLGVREMPTPNKASRMQAVREGLTQLRQTFGEIRKLRVLLIFLVGYWFYIDAVNTVIRTAVFFGDSVLGLPQADLVTALLATQFVAFPAALAFGWLGERLGPRPAILLGLAVYLGAIVYAWRWLETGADFYLLAVAIGLVQGGVQALSRSLYARLVPASKTAEFFGFFNMVGKFASILGPLLMAAVPFVFAGAEARDSILALALLFVTGGFLLWKVDVEKGIKAARDMDGGS